MKIVDAMLNGDEFGILVKNPTKDVDIIRLFLQGNRFKYIDVNQISTGILGYDESVMYIKNPLTKERDLHCSSLAFFKKVYIEEHPNTLLFSMDCLYGLYFEKVKELLSGRAGLIVPDTMIDNVWEPLLNVVCLDSTSYSVINNHHGMDVHITYDKPHSLLKASNIETPPTVPFLPYIWRG